MIPADDRAVSEVIGAVLIFAFLIISFSVYQGIIIPQQNRAVEFEHNQNAQQAIQDLRNAVRQTAATGSEQSISITLGATYPQRVVGRNPGVSGGTLRTQSLGSVTLGNVTATDSEVAEYFGSSTATLGPFESKAFVYRPVYSHYVEAPVTSYENTLAYNAFSTVNLTITDQALIDGRKLTLVALGGNVSAAQQGTVTVDTTAVSTATNTVSVTNQTGPLNVTIPTRLTAANWTDLLDDELDPAGTDPERFVMAIEQTGPNQVSILLEPDVTYELRLAKVGVGDDTPSEGAKYIVDVDGDNTSVIENGTQRLVVEVRDRFNNPVSNVTVTAGMPTAGSISPTSATTEADGQAAFLYTAPDDVDGAEDVSVEMAFGGGGDPNRTVVFDVRVLDADGSGGDGGVSEVNPSGEDRLVLEVVTGTNAETADLTFNNTGDTAITVSELRVPFYFEESGGQDETEVVESFAGVGSFEGADNVSIGAPLTEMDGSVTFSPGTETVTIVFGGSGGNLQTRGDFFILVLRFDSGNTLTYFVSPQ